MKTLIIGTAGCISMHTSKALLKQKKLKPNLIKI